MIGVHEWSKASPDVFHSFRQCWVAELSRMLNGGQLSPELYCHLERPGRSAAELVNDVATYVKPLDPESNGVDPQDERARSLWYSRIADLVVIREQESNRALAIIDITSPGSWQDDRFRRFTEHREFLKLGLVVVGVNLFPGGEMSVDVENRQEEDWIRFRVSSDPEAVGPYRVAVLSGLDSAKWWSCDFCQGEPVPDVELCLASKTVLLPFSQSYEKACEAESRIWRNGNPRRGDE